MLKKYDLYSYKEFISNIIVDDGIKNEIINQIDLFTKDGLIIICGKELCGKMRGLNENYLELKYINNCFICNYTKNNARRVINIVQNKNNDIIKIDRKEVLECPTYNNHSEIFELQRLYSNNKMIYESLITNSQSYILDNCNIKYNTGFLFNGFNMTKKWYFSNNSIVQYRIKKDYYKGLIHEDYKICLEPLKKDYNMVYDFESLDVEVFNDLMLGKISITEVVDNINGQKIKKKGEL